MVNFSASLRNQAREDARQDVSPHLPRFTLPAKAHATANLQQQSFASKVTSCTSHDIAPFERDKNFRAVAGSIADDTEKMLGSACTVDQISANQHVISMVIDVQDHIAEEVA